MLSDSFKIYGIVPTRQIKTKKLLKPIVDGNDVR